MTIYPVILAGGSGTRLWPLSRGVLSEAVSAADQRFIEYASGNAGASRTDQGGGAAHSRMQ